MGFIPAVLFLILASAFLAVHAISPASLGMKHDPVLMETQKRLVFGSIITIPGMGTWLDDKVVDLAFEAHEGMRTAFAALRLPRKPWDRGPSAVTVVLVGDTAYISSSTKGGGSILYEKFAQNENQGTISPPLGKRPYWGDLKTGVCPGAILDGLRKCEKSTPLDEKMGHQNGGACGEVMAAWAMCIDGGPWPESGVRVVAVASDTTGAISIKEPCGFDEAMSKWNPKGCAQFNEHFNWRQIPPTTQRKDCGQPANIQVRHVNYRINIAPAAASSSKTGGTSTPAKDAGGPSSQKKPSKSPKRTLEEEMYSDEDLEDEADFAIASSA